MINFISSDEEEWKGYLYLALLVGVNLLITLLNSNYWKDQELLGLQMRSALTSALFRHTMACMHPMKAVGIGKRSFIKWNKINSKQDFLKILHDITFEEMFKICAF